MEPWKKIIEDQIKPNAVNVNPGDQVEVHYRVIEGEKERIQVFAGTVIAKRGADIGKTFTVRKISSGGIGVERIFPVHSPFVANVIVKRESKVRRAKLYYLRGLKGKAARIKEKVEAR